MAISETILKDLMLMQVAELNANGGLLGKKVEPVVVDPASNWPLFAEKARELISKDKVAAVFGCWTSVSRKSVLPVFEELNGLLFYPLEYEGEESSYNIFYGSSVPDNKAIPAVEYLMSTDGGEREALHARRHRLRLSAHQQQDHPRLPEVSRASTDEDIMENYTPFGFSDWQTEVAAIKKFGSTGKKTAVISTINGDANVPFYKELANQGVKASDIPVIAFSVGEEELAGLDTKPLVGHLAAWSYFESVNTPENKAFIAKWHAYMHDNKRVTNDPMESAYILFHMWVQAVQQAGTTDVDAVRQAMIGQKVKSPSGFEVTMLPNHHMAKPVMIGEVQANGQFTIVYQSKALAAESLEPLRRSEQGQSCRLVLAVGLRRLHRAEIHDLLGALNEHRAQRPGDGTPAVTGFFHLYAFALGRAEIASRRSKPLICWSRIGPRCSRNKARPHSSSRRAGLRRRMLRSGSNWSCCGGKITAVENLAAQFHSRPPLPIWSAMTTDCLRDCGKPSAETSAARRVVEFARRYMRSG